MTRGELQRMEVPRKAQAAMRRQTRGPGGSSTYSSTTCPSNCGLRDRRRDLSPFPSRVTASGMKETHSVGYQRTAMNFPTAFATSYANFILVIGRRSAVESVIRT